MPIFLSALLGGFIQATGSFVGRALIAMGIGFVTYQGMDLLVDNIHEKILLNLQGFDPLIMQILGILKVKQAVNVLISAITARLVIKGLTSDGMKKMVFK